MIEKISIILAILSFFFYLRIIRIFHSDSVYFFIGSLISYSAAEINLILSQILSVDAAILIAKSSGTNEYTAIYWKLFTICFCAISEELLKLLPLIIYINSDNSKKLSVFGFISIGFWFGFFEKVEILFYYFLATIWKSAPLIYNKYLMQFFPINIEVFYNNIEELTLISFSFRMIFFVACMSFHAVSIYVSGISLIQRNFKTIILVIVWHIFSNIMYSSKYYIFETNVFEIFTPLIDIIICFLLIKYYIFNKLNSILITGNYKVVEHHEKFNNLALIIILFIVCGILFIINFNLELIHLISPISFFIFVLFTFIAREVIIKLAHLRKYIKHRNSSSQDVGF